MSATTISQTVSISPGRTNFGQACPHCVNSNSLCTLTTSISDRLISFHVLLQVTCHNIIPGKSSEQVERLSGATVPIGAFRLPLSGWDGQNPLCFEEHESSSVMLS